MFSAPSAQLVYDGNFRLPEGVGEPREDQLCGSGADKLCELGGRICYDSLGKGRGSSDYHEHIRSVGHLSVYEHYNFTVEFEPLAEDEQMTVDLVGRPGVSVVFPARGGLRVTANLRAVAEWDKWTIPDRPVRDQVRAWLRDAMARTASSLAPLSCPYLFGEPELDASSYCRAAPVADSEAWVSILIRGSRGLSHEAVRHRLTAISQRSTRYVDEDESPWVLHPAIRRYMSDEGEGAYQEVRECASRVYREIRDRLTEETLKNGVDKATARKQARGAARGVLGNALETELLLSASCAQWIRMLKLRLHAAADAEIRVLFAQVLRILQGSRYASFFADMTTVPSPDGIGEVLR